MYKMMTILTKFCGKEKNTGKRKMLSHELSNPNEWYALDRRGYRK